MRLTPLLCGLGENFAIFAVKSFLVLLVATSFACAQANQLPPEVRYKHAYVNPVPKPPDFSSAMLWGIAIADTRVPGYKEAQIEIAHVQLSCRVGGKDVVLNDDRGAVRGGLFRRYLWFGTDARYPIPLAYSDDHRVVILRVGTHPDRVWHFWAASARAEIPPGKLKGCTVKARVRISAGALLQMGFDYWRNATVDYGPGGNNHEAGGSDWYLPSDQWQDAVFSDVAN